MGKVKRMKILYRFLMSFLLVIFAATASAAPEPLTVQQFVDKMVHVHQYDRRELVHLFQKTEYLPEVIDRVNRPFEEKPWDFYKNFFITTERINDGIQYWQEHAVTLQKAAQQYGVSPAVIVAIIGIETKYGKETGKFSTLRTLATLSFRYPKRAVFFQKELENYLLLTRDYQLAPLELYGSYAGALGIPQFMPSNYRQFAVSYDGKPSVNLLQDHDDAIASIAFYLQKAGWRNGQPVAVPAVIADGKAKPWLFSKDAKPIFRIRTLAKFGINAAEEQSPMRKSALIVMHNTHDQEYWITFQNFYAIMAYNPRTTYAMAIYQLSEAIRKGYGQGTTQKSPTVTASR